MASTPVKKRLRIETVAAILNLDEADRVRQEHEIMARVAASPAYRRAGTVLLYIKAFPEEIDTGPLLEDALAAGKRVACPRVDRKAGGLVLHEVRSLADLHAGVLNIPEPRRDAPVVAPEVVDWVLAPGVAFDGRCNRLGRGAGHYDRLLPRFRDGVEAWAAAFDLQVVDALPVEAHDVPLAGVFTATRTITRD